MAAERAALSAELQSLQQREREQEGALEEAMSRIGMLEAQLRNTEAQLGDTETRLAVTEGKLRDADARAGDEAQLAKVTATDGQTRLD